MTDKPITAAMLSDALGCFWNAAIGAAHNHGDGMATADIMAQGMQAVANRLIEISEAEKVEESCIDQPVTDSIDLSETKITDAQINQLTMDLLGRWPSFEAQSWACKVAKIVLMSQDTDIAPDLALIPAGWWLYGLFHNHTPTIYAGDKHEPMTLDAHGTEPWTAKLQSVDGGKLTVGSGASPGSALRDAIREVELRWFDRDAGER